jgi:hypothetical protein
MSEKNNLIVWALLLNFGRFLQEFPSLTTKVLMIENDHISKELLQMFTIKPLKQLGLHENNAVAIDYLVSRRSVQKHGVQCHKMQTLPRTWNWDNLYKVAQSKSLLPPIHALLSYVVSVTNVVVSSNIDENWKILPVDNWKDAPVSTQSSLKLGVVDPLT